MPYPQSSNYIQSSPQEDLRLNSLLFSFPSEPVTFWFSREDRDGVSLTPLTHTLFPSNIDTIFPGLQNDAKIYTSFTRKLDGFTALPIDFNDPNNFDLVKKFYNKEIRHYFEVRDKIVETTYINDNQIWIKSKDKQKNAIKDCVYFDRYTLKVSYNYAMHAPELVISFDRPGKILNKSVASFIREYNDSVDPFGNSETNPVDLLNRVLKVTRRTKDRRKVYKVIKYSRLHEDEDRGDKIDYEHIYPIVNNKLAAYLGYAGEEEDDNPYENRNRYKKYVGKISDFNSQYLQNAEFRGIVQITSDFTSVSAGNVPESSKRLVFGKNGDGVNVTDVVPQRGINNGPFLRPQVNRVKLLCIAYSGQREEAVQLCNYLKYGYGSGYNRYAGLSHYLGIQFEFIKGILFNSADNPIPEISKALSEKGIDPTDRYIAIYLTPVSKSAKSLDQRIIYYHVKELLLRYDIAVQCIETDKMSSCLASDARKNKSGFTYTLQNMSIAINAKLGGTPWRIAVPKKRELVIGIGAFKNMDSNVQYIGSAFSFDNTGSFNSFDYFHKDELRELAGSIQEAVQNFRNLIEAPSRLILHYYKEMNERDAKIIENALYEINVDVPIYVVTINKTESEDYIVFDRGYRDLMPYSGRFVNLGKNTFLLCNNTRYENGYGKSPEGYPFPVKMKIKSPNAPETLDQNTISGLIDQVYQFSRIYWKSVRQQNLPVTIKYPEMVAQIAPYFTGGNLPDNMGRDNLWFL